MNENIMIPLIVFAFIFAAFYVYITTRNKERMALIEKGASADLFKGKPMATQFLSLKFGFFFIGVAIGVLLGNILDNYTGLDDGACYISGIFLFGGLGLVLGYLYQAKREKENK